MEIREQCAVLFVSPEVRIGALGFVSQPYSHPSGNPWAERNPDRSLYSNVTLEYACFVQLPGRHIINFLNLKPNKIPETLNPKLLIKP